MFRALKACLREDTETLITMRRALDRFPAFVFLGCLLLLVLLTNLAAQEWMDPEDYCVRCHDPHEGLDVQVQTCMSCHESVPFGQMGLYPWYSSEAALAGICCRTCHAEVCKGDSCLSCHRRHADPLR